MTVRARHPRRVTAAALVLATLVPTALGISAGAAAQAAPAPSAAGSGKHGNSVGFALFGDTPYGQAQIDSFPRSLAEITGYPGVDYAVHVGDIKNGSSRCDTSYFQWVRGQFDASQVPLVYTPGDNEWTDCHRANNGAYNPLERLAALRSVMYSRNGQTLGAGNLHVRTQAKQGLPENAEWTTNKAEFAAINVQGSHNGLDPWTGLGKTAPTSEQLAEFQQRQAANLAMIRQQFQDVQRTHGTAVVFVMQADMFDFYLAEDPAAARAAFGSILNEIARGAKESGKPVYILNGDSHSYKDQRPLAAGSQWLSVYGLDAVPNLRQITVEGAAESHEFAFVTVNSQAAVKKGAEPLEFRRVPIR